MAATMTMISQTTSVEEKVKGTDASPSAHPANPYTLKVSGSAAASAHGPLRPEIQPSTAPGTVTNAMAVQTAAATSMRV